MNANLAPLGPKAGKESVRRHNLSLVLRAVLDEGEATRAQIAARVGLTRAAVSSLVDQLIEAGFLAEHGKAFSGQAGRPGTVLRPGRTGPAGLGVEVNVDYLTASVTDLPGADRVRLTEHADNRAAGPEEALGRAALLAAQAVAAAEEQGLRPVGAQLALPGLVADGTVRQAPNLGWQGVEAGRLFAAALERLRPGRPALPVAVGNEADLAALAELWFGDIGPLRSFLYITGEIGIGGALVVDGELFRGAHGFAGEIGHMVVHPDGPRCRCGARGCLEQYAGQAALLRAAGLPQDAGMPGVAELQRRAAAGEPAAVAAVRRAGEMLGLVLAGAVNLLDPEAVVLGGIYRGLAGTLAPAADQELTCRVVSGLWAPGHGRIRASSPAADAARGAAGRAVRAVLADPARFAGPQQPAG